MSKGWQLGSRARTSGRSRRDRASGARPPGDFEGDVSAGSRSVWTPNRRQLLQAGASAAALTISADLMTVAARAASPSSRFFVYGAADPHTAPAVSGGRGGSSGLTSVVSDLAAAPVRSQDGTAIACATLNQTSSDATVGIGIVSAASGTVTARGSVYLPDVPADSYVLVTPAFAPDASMLALVLSVSVPTDRATITKVDPTTGKPATLDVIDRASHHEIAYFDCSSGAVSGPFDLADGPSLARVNAATDGHQLYVWSLADPRDYTLTKKPQGSGLTPQLSLFEVGQGKPRLQLPAPGPWPVNREPLAVVSSGEVARMAFSREVELYSPQTGVQRRIAPTALQPGSAQPGAPTMDVLTDGSVLLTNAAIGSALVADPTSDWAAQDTVSFPAPEGAAGAGRKIAISEDRQTLYAVAPRLAGGISAYDVSSGALVASYSNGADYRALRALSDGSVVAVSTKNPKVTVFDPSLKPVSQFTTATYVADVL